MTFTPSVSIEDSLTAPCGSVVSPSASSLIASDSALALLEATDKSSASSGQPSRRRSSRTDDQEDGLDDSLALATSSLDRTTKRHAKNLKRKSDATAASADVSSQQVSPASLDQDGLASQTRASPSIDRNTNRTKNMKGKNGAASASDSSNSSPGSPASMDKNTSAVSSSSPARSSTAASSFQASTIGTKRKRAATPRSASSSSDSDFYVDMDDLTPKKKRSGQKDETKMEDMTMQYGDDGDYSDPGTYISDEEMPPVSSPSPRRSPRHSASPASSSSSMMMYRKRGGNSSRRGGKGTAKEAFKRREKEVERREQYGELRLQCIAYYVEYHPKMVLN